jgi:spore coat protein A, manganese oxidase
MLPRNRRQFLTNAILAAAGSRASAQDHRMPDRGAMRGLSLSPLSLDRYVDPLPIPSVATPPDRIPDPANAKVKIPRYRIAMREFHAKVHRDLPATTFWGYSGTSPGPTFEARSGQPMIVEWSNNLPAQHLFRIDHTLHGAERDNPQVRTVVHLHGGKVPPESDGDPERWIAPGQSQTCYYPNRQPAAPLFYHDHAMGITRLNATAGLFGMYLLRDAEEDALNLPKGRFEIPIAIYDRLFKTDGQLDYPVSGDPASPWISEFYGNAILLNGKLFPALDVEPCRYRFRIFNTSNSGFYTLSFAADGGSLTPGTEPFLMIGSDQGLLTEAVAMRGFQIVPGERADLVIDFARFAGKSIYLKHGSVPVMQIRVSGNKMQDRSRQPSNLRPISRMAESDAVKTRELTLDHHMNAAGKATLMLLNGSHYSMSVTETPLLDSTEIWTLVNLTDDTHPIHLHLVRFQILDRRRFDFEAYRKTKKLVFTGPPVPPDPQEAGWKDTVRADVLMATRIIVHFEGYAGRYVWHCHVLEHEDNEMMRPYEVVAAPRV